MERNAVGRTALHVACAQGDAQAVHSICSSEPLESHELAARDRYGLTALDYAVLGGHRAIVEALSLAASAPGDAFPRLLRSPGRNDDREEDRPGGEEMVVVAELNPKDMAPANKLTLSADRTKVMTHRKWGSVRATVGLRLGDVGKTCYYEASVESQGVTQIGWATKHCRLGKHEGVGDDKHSWAWDSFRECIWHAGTKSYRNVPRWHPSDVLTLYATVVALLPEKEESTHTRRVACVLMGARINGNDVGLESTVELPIESEDDVLYPGVSLRQAQAVTFNFGYHPFKHAGKDTWVSVAEAASSWALVKEHVASTCMPYPLASPVHLAAASGQSAVLEYLLANVTPDVGAELLFARDDKGRIPFHYACRFSGGDVKTVQVLLAQEERLAKESTKWSSWKQYEMPDDFGRRALAHACDQPRVEVVQVLLCRVGVDANLPDVDNMVPLFYAIRHDCAPIASLLLVHGVSVDESHDRLGTALAFAARNCALQCIKLLVSRGADTSPKAKQQLLLQSCSFSSHAVARYLLASGLANVSERNARGASAVLVAARSSSIACVELLLKHGASLADTDDCQTNVLMMAASGRNAEMVRWLIEDKRIDVHAVNRINETALCFAAKSGSVEIVRALIEHGARADHRSRINNRTPFFIAAERGREEVCEFMLANGHGDLLARDNNGFTALMLACQAGSLNCVQLLLAHGAGLGANNVDTSLVLLAAQSGNLPLLRLLVTPETVNIRDELHVSLLLHACHRGNAECIEHLLSLGASIHDADYEGSDALMHAAMGDNDKLIDWLVDVKKFDIDVKNWDDMAAIDIAIRNGNLDAATALLVHGAELVDPPAESRSVDTLPLAQACMSGSVDMVHLLLDQGFSFDDPTTRRCCVQACVESRSVTMCRFVLDQLDELNASSPNEDNEDDVDDEELLLDPLLEALADNHTVARLNLRGHSLDNAAALPRLVDMLARNRHLAYLDLRDAPITLEHAEMLVDRVSALNRSLLTLELDVDALQAAAEEEARGVDELTEDSRRKRLRQTIDEMAVRALGYRRKVATTAIHMLVAARLLLRGGDALQFDDEGSMQQEEVVAARLPLELLESIAMRVDTERVLEDEERKRVLAFASHDMAATRGCTREQFLRECVVSLTWWPSRGTPAPRDRESDPNADEDADEVGEQTTATKKKAKTCPDE